MDRSEISVDEEQDQGSDGTVGPTDSLLFDGESNPLSPSVDGGDTAPTTPPRRGPSRRTKLIITLTAPVVGLLLVELALRAIVLTDVLADAAWAADLRNPIKYTRPRSPSGSDYWKLFYSQQAPEDRWLPQRHPILGWIREDFDPATYQHEQEARLAGRRPVLLFGSSFVRCLPPVAECHEDLLERSPLAADLALINFSVTGYGLGQVGILTALAVDRFRALDPIVVVAIHVDEDLDRLSLSFRHGPKPRFSASEEGGLAIEVPDQLDVDRYLEAHPIEIRSYAWNHLLFGTGLVPNPPRERLRGTLAHGKTIVPLVPRALAQIQSVLGGLDYFILVVGSPATIKEGFKGDWRHSSLMRSIETLNLPYVSAHEMLREAVEVERRPISDFINPANGHPNAEGVVLIQRALERGLMGDFDSP